MNSCLPYDIPPNEATDLLADIKENIKLSCLKADFAKGVFFWTRQLENYIELKHELPIADRIWLANIYFELICLPEVDFVLLDHWAKVLWVLVEKDFMFENTTFNWPWRPLFQILESSLSPQQRQKVLPSRGRQIESLIDIVPLISRYFYPGATDEILAEFLPRLNPNMVTAFIPAIAWISMFLPYQVKAAADPLEVGRNLERRLANKTSFKPSEQLYWVDHLFDIWSALLPSRSVDTHLLDLFSRISCNQFGRDTFYFSAKHLRYMLNVAHRWTELPIGSGLSSTEGGGMAIGTKRTLSQGQVLTGVTIKAIDDISASGALLRKKRDRTRMIAFIIVYNIFPASFYEKGHHPHEKQDNSISFLETWLHSLEGFYHPSNSGKWTQPLVRLLQNIAETVAFRLQVEAQPMKTAGSFPNYNICNYGPEFHLDRDACVRIVKALRPAALLSMFGKDANSVATSHNTLHYLMNIAPSLIFPHLLDRIYPSLETLTESHRTNSAIGALSSITIPMLHRINYPYGATHLLTLMNATLPALDLNDISKARITTIFYIKVLMFVPLADLSSGVQNADPQTSQIVQSTSLFEEWVHGYVDKCFHLFEHLNLADSNSDESGFMHLVTFVLDLVANQLKVPKPSPAQSDLVKSIVDRVGRFLSERVMHNPVNFIDDLVSSFTHPFSAEMFALLPLFKMRILDELESGAGASKEKGFRQESAENPFGRDSSLAWFLKALRGLATAVGLFAKDEAMLQKHVSAILEIVGVCWEKCYSRPIYKLVCKIYRSLVKSLGETWITEHRSFFDDSDMEQELDLWGVTLAERFQRKQGSGAPRDRDAEWKLVKPSWHRPSALEKKFLLTTLERALPLELEKIESWAKDASLPSGIEGNFLACKSLTLVANLLKSISMMVTPVVERDAQEPLPLNDEDMELELDDDDGSDDEPESACQTRPIRAAYCFEKSEEGHDQIVAYRDRIGKALLSFCKYARETREDDTETFRILVKMIRIFINDRGMERQAFTDHLRSYRYTKTLVQNGTYPYSRRYPRHMLLRRIAVQEYLRVRHNSVMSAPKDPNCTEVLLLKELLAFSVYSYAITRALSQDILAKCIRLYKSFKYELLETVLRNLENDCREVMKFGTQESEIPEALHSRIKGALYLVTKGVLFNVCLRNPKISKLFILTMCLVVQVDKPSIQNIVNQIANDFASRFTESPFFALPSESLLKLVTAADNSHEPPSEVLGRLSGVAEKKKAERIEQISGVRTSLLEIIAQKVNPHWRFQGLVLGQLELLNREEVPVSASVFDFVVKSVQSDVMQIRRLALVSFLRILFCLKKRSVAHLQRAQPELLKKYKYVTSSASEVPADVFYGLDRISEIRHVVDRGDICWFSLSEKVTVYSLDGINPVETFLCDPESKEAVSVLLEALKSNAFWTKILTYASQEAASLAKSAVTDEHLNPSAIKLYKVAFQLSHDSILYDIFEPILSKWCANVADKTLQRAAIEVITGLIRGMKHWTLPQKEKCWKWLLPQLKSMLLGCTPETLGLWNQAFHYISSHRHPARLYPLIKMMLFDADFAFDMKSDSAFNEAKKISLVRLLFRNFGNRLSSFALPLLQKICTAEKLSSRYKNVRDAVGTLIWELCLASSVPTDCRLSSSTWIADMKRSSDSLISRWFYLDPSAQANIATAVGIVRDLQKATVSANDKSKDKVYGSNYSNASKTLIKFVVDAVGSGRPYMMIPTLVDAKAAGGSPFLLDIFSMQMMSDDKDLAEAAQLVLSIFPDVPMALHLGDQCAMDVVSFFGKYIFAQKEGDEEKNRRMKLRGLAMLQVYFFRALFFTAFQDSIVSQLFDFLSKLLKDPLVEVRQLASITLSGLVRSCGDAGIKDLETRFSQWLGPVRRRSDNAKVMPAEQITKNHAAILGLSALVIAFPYTVPKWMPDTLVLIGKHQLEPAPVSTSVRSLFTEFRRTHQDTWSDVVGKGDEYLELYGYSVVPTAHGASNRQPDETERGIFTKQHLEDLSDLLTSHGQYYA